jgi:hypothetical protein
MILGDTGYGSGQTSAALRAAGHLQTIKPIPLRYHAEPLRNYEAGKVAETQGNGGFLAAIIGDGVLLLLATAASLVLAGGFATLLAASGEFLPHDIAYLGMSAADLCSIAHCRPCLAGMG